MSAFNMLLFMTVFSVVRSVAGFCECGYGASISVNGSLQTFLFTDIIESDFLHVPNVAYDTDWSRQNYSVTAADARGPYGPYNHSNPTSCDQIDPAVAFTNPALIAKGPLILLTPFRMQFTVDNIISNPLPNASAWSGPGTVGPEPGVQLIVDGGIPANGNIAGAQMNSVRQDLLFGTYRALMKLPSVSGTCGAFFWYYNNSQELDMELLSSQFYANNNTGLVNLVDQSLASVTRGYAIPGTEYMVDDLPFDPSDGYHEYRIDFIPGQIIYYADEQVIGTLNGTIPSMPGHMILTQWSNGDKGWSGGPPATEAIMAVAGVRAYFNSSNPNRQAAAERRCTDPTASESICSIPDWYPNNDLFTDYFSNDQNKTHNQTVYGKNAAASPIRSPARLVCGIVCIVLMIGLATTAGII